MNYREWLKKACHTAYTREESVSYYNLMYDDGLLLLGLYYADTINPDSRFRPFLLNYVNHFITEDGTIPYIANRPLSLDNIHNGKVFFLAWEHTKSPAYKKALDFLYELYQKHPRNKETGGLWHKMRYPEQMWLDGFFMLHPFISTYASAFDKPEIFDDIELQFSLVNSYLYDETAQLYYHACDFSKQSFWCNKDTGLSPNFWGRSIGWLGMAAVDVLDTFPADHKGRETILLTIQRLADGFVRWQNQKSGCFYQLPTLPDEPENYLESSASCMFVYTLLKAVRKGYLDSRYLPAAQKGLDGILTTFASLDSNDQVHLSSVCQVAGLGPEKKKERDGSIFYYLHEPVVMDDNKGFGAFICALTEGILLLE